MATSAAARCAWREAFDAALEANKHLDFSRYFTLATVGLDGKPSCRMVVMRTLDNNAIVLSTDIRSKKIQEMRQNSSVEACFYFALTKEQFRLSCDSIIVGDEEDAKNTTDRATHSAQEQDNVSRYATLRRRVWSDLSDALRLSFASAQPGAPAAEATRNDLERYEPQPLNRDMVNRHFALVLLTPRRVDHLKLPNDFTIHSAGKPIHRESNLQPAKQMRRWIHDLSAETGEWTTTAVNP